MTVTVVFHPSWLYSDGGIHAGAARRLETELKRVFESSLKSNGQSTAECRFFIEESGAYSAAAVMEKIDDILRSIAAPLEIQSVCTVRAVDHNGAELSLAKQPETKSPGAETNAPDLSSLILDAIRSSEKNGSDERESIKEAVSSSISSGGEQIPGSDSSSAGMTTSRPSVEETAVTVGKTVEDCPAEEVSAFSVDDMVGNREFKKLLNEIRLRAERIKKNGTAAFFFSRAYLFSVNPGNGYRTSIRLLEEVLHETGLFSSKSDPIDYVLPSPGDIDVSQKLSNIIGTLETCFGNQRIVCFDISSWIGKTDTADFKHLLLRIFQLNTKCLVIFKTPYVRERLQSEIVSDISDIVSVKPIIFEPFSCEELRQIAKKMLVPYGIRFSDVALEEFDRRIEEEKRDGYFYGVHTIKKIVGNFVREMEFSDESDNDAGKIITKAMASCAGTNRISEEEPGFDGFAEMIGMGYVESRLREAVAQIQFARSKGLGKPCMHMFFTGNPGTGKTTVARMLGNELKKNHILRIGKFYEHKGRDLCGEYVGQTAPKTTKICEQAYGSILFIDEAYSLAGNSSNDYGKEAVDTLIAEMENHYDDLVVIFAGYPEEMETLLALNPGMRSRVPYTIEFSNYTKSELYQIFIALCEKNFVLAPGFEAHAKQFFLNLQPELMKDRSFGNARFVRNIYERVWGKALTRCVDNKNASVELTVGDFDMAASEMRV